MKRILLFCLMLFSTFGFSQSLAVFSATHANIGNANSSDEIISYIRIRNNASVPVEVKVKRIDKNYNALTDSNAICWAGTCHGTQQSVSGGSQMLNPGDISGVADFSGHVYPDGDGVPLTGDITYVFYDVNNPSDSVAHTVTYEVDPTFGSLELNADKALKLFPNPATDRVTIEYDLVNNSTSTFELVSVVGNRVYQRQLKDPKGEFKLDISKLSRGVYFYILRQDGKAILTRKLVVQ